MLYLVRTQLKNRLIKLVKTPSQLIVTLLMLVLIVFVFFTTTLSDESAQLRSVEELNVIVFALFTLMFILTSNNGFSAGASMYSMADVNFVFVSPISPQKVLFYGLIRQLSTSLLLGFFIIFQYPWMHNVYGIDFLYLLSLLFGYAVVVFCGQLTAMVIYSFTSFNNKLKSIIRTCFFIVALVPVVYAAVMLIQDNEDILATLIRAGKSDLMSYYPVSGWVKSIIAGTSPMALLGLVGIVLYIGAFILIIFKKRMDFYEDVLSATEQTFKVQQAVRSGHVETAPKNIKLGDTGINKGEGASVFYQKHAVENRRSRVFIMDSASLMFAAISIAMPFFMKDLGIVGILAFSSYMQMFSVGMGRALKELMLHYVYIIPEPPFKKLINCLKEGFGRVLVESLVVMIPVSVIMQLAPLEAVACIVARISYGIIFIASNIFSQRFFGGIQVKAIAMMVFIFTSIIFIAPGILGAIFLTPVLSLNIYVSFFILTAINLLIAVGTLYASRNLLVFSELMR